MLRSSATGLLLAFCFSGGGVLAERSAGLHKNPAGSVGCYKEEKGNLLPFTTAHLPLWKRKHIMSIRAGAKASTAPSPSPSNFKTVTKYMLGFDVYAVADAGILLGITKMASALSAQDGNLFQSVLDVLTWILLVNFSDAMMKYVQKATSGLGLSPDRKPLDMEWYKTIAKPSWTPPNIAFPIVWGILKILQTTALVIAWRAGGRKLTLSIGLFLIHLCIGDVWNRIFFANHHMGTGMVVIVKMWLWLAATIYFMCSDSPAAGALLVPTLVWLTIASALNISIWSLNGKESIWPKVPALKEKKAT